MMQAALGLGFMLLLLKEPVNRVFGKTYVAVKVEVGAYLIERSTMLYSATIRGILTHKMDCVIYEFRDNIVKNNCRKEHSYFNCRIRFIIRSNLMSIL